MADLYNVKSFERLGVNRTTFLRKSQDPLRMQPTRHPESESKNWDDDVVIREKRTA